MFSPEYPVESWPLFLVEDMPAAPPDAFGPLGRVWIGNRLGLKPYARSDLDAEAQGQLSRVLDVLRRDAVAVFRYRAAAAAADGSKERFQQTERLEKSLRRSIAAHRDQTQSVSDLSDRLGPTLGERTVTLADVLSVSPPTAAAAVVTAAASAPAAVTPGPPRSTATPAATPEGGAGAAAPTR